MPRLGVVVHPQVRITAMDHATQPPTFQRCEATYGIPCYGPTQLETAYDEQPLFRLGLTGRGETVAVVDSFGAPTIRPDLAYFDRVYGLPAPPSFEILRYGTVPAYTPSIATMTGWAEETTLDVEYAHAMAPGANILLVETATAETVGVTGFPTIVNAENDVIDHHLASVISQSFGAGEPTFAGPATILGLRSSFLNAYRSGVTVLAASGDEGATQGETVTALQYFPYRSVGWPASDPLVTAVGGTQLSLNTRGRQIAPPAAWNDTATSGGPAATGGGLSTVFTRPSYQNGVAGVVGSRRGVPDISMSASNDKGPVLAYISLPTLGRGWLLIGGTSEATPEMAGIVAIADQLHGHQPLGLIDPAIYAMSQAHDPGIVTVTTGNNSVAFTSTGTSDTVPGFSAGPGYNLATGVGTVDATLFVRELVATVDSVGTSATYGESPTFLPHG